MDHFVMKGDTTSMKKLKPCIVASSDYNVASLITQFLLVKLNADPSEVPLHTLFGSLFGDDLSLFPFFSFVVDFATDTS